MTVQTDSTPHNDTASSVLPDGVWPVALTPFTDEGEVDYKGYQELVEWYLSKGAAGIFAVCLSSEYFQLTAQERLRLASITCETVHGRVPVIASSYIGKDHAQKLESVKQMQATGVDVVVVMTNQLADESESDQVLLERFNVLTELCGDIRLGLYECPTPYKRLLTAPLLRDCAESEKLVFLKDTCCDAQLLEEKLKAIRDLPVKLYNANTQTLPGSLLHGASGYNGPGANYIPEIFKKLVDSYKAGEGESEYCRTLFNLTQVLQCFISNKYIRGAKLFLKMRGVKIGDYCRLPVEQFNPAEYQQLLSLHELLQGPLADLI